MRRPLYLGTFTCIALGALAAPALAAAPGKELISTADLARGHSDGVVWAVTVEERNASGEVQSGEYKVQSKGFNSVVDFVAPAQTKGRKLLMVDRNMWFYRPGLSRPVPISPRQRLMGNASNGDLASTNYADLYEVTKAWEETAGAEPCYVFDLKAKTTNATYDRIKYWISKRDVLGLKAEYYTVSGKLLKTATFEYSNSVANGSANRRFISRMVINDPSNSSSVTTLLFRSPKLTPLPDSTFSLNLVLR